LQCGTTLILPPGMAHCSPCTNADVRMGINRKVSSFVKTPPASRGSQVPLDTTHHGVHQASDSAGVSPVKVLVARPATVKIKAISRRVSLAVALAEWWWWCLITIQPDSAKKLKPAILGTIQCSSRVCDWRWLVSTVDKSMRSY
jgi:hypothetical protein